VAQKLMQDVFTVVLLVTAIMVIVMAGVMAVTVLEKSGMLQSDMALTSLATNSANSLQKSMPVHASDSYNDCEVINHLASLRSEYAIVASETGQDTLPALYYAVYMCTGTATTVGRYI